MPLTKILDYACDLAEPVRCQPVRTAFVTGDSQAHRIRLQLLHGGESVSPDGLTVTGYMIRADDTTVIFHGEAADGALCVTLPPACYAIPGRFHFLLRGERDGTVSTLLWLEGTVTIGSTDAVLSPDEPIPSLSELLAQLGLLADATRDAQSAAQEAHAAADESREASALLSEKFSTLTRCFVQPDAPENPLRGDLWVTSAGMEMWGDLREEDWEQAASGTWAELLTAENPVLHVFDGVAWRTFYAILA